MQPLFLAREIRSGPVGDRVIVIAVLGDRANNITDARKGERRARIIDDTSERRLVTRHETRRVAVRV